MHFLQYIHWDPDPSIFGLPLRWYGLLFASSFFFGYILMNRIFKLEHAPHNWLESLTVYMALSTVIGARLGHCLFYDPGYYLSHPLEILKIWEGGLASHGAAIGIITGLLLWSRRVSKRSVLWILDRIVIMVALSGLTIRAGNLMNSEILGKETTASYGFVFPRADQGEAIRAKWEGEKVELTYNPTPINQARQFDFYRSSDEKVVHLVNTAHIGVPAGNLRQPLKLTDANPGTRGHLRYVSAEVSDKPATTVSNGDSLHPRTATFSDPFAEGKLAFGGRWEGDMVHLKFDMRGMVSGGSSRGTMLLRSAGNGDWNVIYRGVLDGNPKAMVLDTIDNPGSIENPEYRLIVKEDESLLVARHPAQIYEAVAYTIIFVFLLWLYYRKQGKLPLGQHFGIFLVLIFAMRFLIEFGKEEQAEFLMGSPLNMGQLLSIPFVLAGIFFIVRSIRNPKFPPAQDSPTENPSETSSKSK
jgi:prolipoprotein diacylglyceryltransferase